MTGICQVYAMYMTYGIYLVYTCHMTMFSYDRYIPGIFQVYTSVRRMSGIYQVYTIIINFQGFPSPDVPGSATSANWGAIMTHYFFPDILYAL